MIHQWQQKKNEEERFMEEHENPENEQNIKDHLNHYKGIELTVMEKKFHQDSRDTTDSVSSSVKYLLKKRKKTSGLNNLPKNNKINFKIEEIDLKLPNFSRKMANLNENLSKTVTLADMDKYNDIFDL